MSELPPSPPPLPASPSKRWGPALICIAIALAAAWIVYAPFGSSLPLKTIGSPLPCAFRVISGLPCALCGGTRAVRNLARGNLERALYFNPLAVLIVGAASLTGAVIVLEAIFGRKLVPRPTSITPRTPRTRWLLILVGFVLLIPWTLFHAWSAVREPKPELINPAHPVVRWLSQR